jgi:diacylglycerol O-acyltransferase / wax synthase
MLGDIGAAGAAGRGEASMSGRVMSPADSVWYQGESPVNPMTISAILWFDRSLQVERLRRVIDERILERHPVFRQRVVRSRVPGVPPRWEDEEDFDLSRHLSVVTLPEPGDHTALEERCSVERSTPLDHDRPLWSVTVYEGYRGSRSALHVRIHHCIGDGLALMQLLLTLTDEHGTIAAAQEPTPFHREIVHLGREALGIASHLALHPASAAGTLRRAAEAVVWGARLLAPAVAERSVLQGRPEGVKRLAWDPEGFPLEPLRAAAHERDATINDLLLTILGGGLRRHLVEHGDVVDDVLVMVPVNLRRRGEQLPRHLGNRIGLLPVLLPVRSEDAEERLAILRERIDRLKRSPAATVSRALLLGTSLATPGVERGIHRLNQLHGTGVVTNVPGPREPLHVGGARLTGIVGWGGMTGHLNLGGAFVSLSGRVYPGLLTDAAITPDPGRILSHVAREWDLLVGPRSPAEPGLATGRG